MEQLTPVQRALAKFDNSPTKMAAALSAPGCAVVRQHVEHWVKSGRVPTEHCRAVFDLTGVPPWEFRPADWHRIWPDLIRLPGAPAVPVFEIAVPGLPPGVAHDRRDPTRISPYAGTDIDRRAPAASEGG